MDKSAKHAGPWLALSLMALLSACATLGAGPNGPGRDKAGEAPQLPPLAIRDHQRITENFGGEVSLPAVQKLAGDIFTRLGPVSDQPALRYRLTVLNSPTINAFALPSGHIYITRGMLALINDTSELAAVLGHEMAHVFASHALLREEQAKTDEIVAALRARVLNDPKGAEERRASGKLTLASFSRAQELEADKAGIALLARAGFDPRGAVRVLKNLDAYNRLQNLAAPQGFMASHPTTPERIEQAVLAARHYSGPDIGERDREPFLKAIDGLAFGEDPKNGLVQGAAFFHPRLGFAINAPEGFTLQNGKDAVTGTGPSDMGFRLDAARLQAGQTLRDYLQSGWVDSLVPQSIDTMTINGFEAVTGISRGPDWSFRVYVVRMGQEIYRIIYAAHTLDATSDAAFQTSMGTFRALSAQEAKLMAMPRLRTVKIPSGSRLETLTMLPQSVPRPLETLHVLNGFIDGVMPQGGTSAKVFRDSAP